MTTQTQTHDHATMYALLAGGGMLVLGIIAVWFFAS
jgi:hypothetical protein